MVAEGKAAALTSFLRAYTATLGVHDLIGNETGDGRFVT